MRFYPRELFEQIHEDWVLHGRDWTQPGFRALAVHRFGKWVVIKSRRSRLLSLLRPVHRLVFRYVRNHYAIDIRPETIIGRRVLLAHPVGIVIHGCAVIGDDCIIRQNATLGALNGERAAEAPKLGRGVHIGCGAAILGPVTVGDDARIGPNAVVMTDVPAGATVFVTPPRMMMSMRRTEANGHKRPPSTDLEAKGA